MTSDHDRIPLALAHIGNRSPDGATNIGYAIDFASAALLSRPEPADEMTILLLAGGGSTLPNLGDSEFNARASLGAANRAREAGIRIHTFAVGPDAADGSEELEAIASVTGGMFASIVNAEDLANLRAPIGRLGIRHLRITNDTLKQDSLNQIIGSAGAFAGLVPLRFGSNQISASVQLLNDETLTATIVEEPPVEPQPDDLDLDSVALIERLMETTASAP